MQDSNTNTESNLHENKEAKLREADLEDFLSCPFPDCESDDVEVMRSPEDGTEIRCRDCGARAREV